MTSQRNMLSVKYEKMHGMKDDRWVCKDKIIQYKGLIKLYTRDNAITVSDDIARRKKQFREIKDLKKDIENRRDKLKNLIQGDRQELRNALAEHRNMQLAYQELPAQNVVDHVYQDNFLKRKKLDLLKYQMRQKTQKLIDIKLYHSVLEDRLKYDQFTKYPIEEYAGIVTGKVQDAILKKEAALVVKQAYTKIIDIMKKDALYHGAILSDLKKDGIMQSICMINATQMGQIATEYLDDRQQEFKTLEKQVTRDITQYKTDVEKAQADCTQASSDLKFLIRRDSDINLGRIDLPKEEDDLQLERSIDELEKILHFLQRRTAVEHFENIFPCLEQQLKHNQRLLEFRDQCKVDLDCLLNKLNHAKTMKNMLYNSMLDSTNEYKSEKKRLLNELEHEKQRKAKAERVMMYRSDLFAKMAIDLDQLQAVCKIVAGDKSADVKTKGVQIAHDVLSSGEPLYRQKVPEDVETDALKIVQILAPKLSRLAQASLQGRDVMNEDEAMKFFEKFIAQNSKRLAVAEVKRGQGLFDDDTITEMASCVPTREEIKNISQAIVKQNTRSDDY